MNRLPDVLCALKHIIPTSGPGRVENELKCLQDIGYVCQYKNGYKSVFEKLFQEQINS